MDVEIRISLSTKEKGSRKRRKEAKRALVSLAAMLLVAAADLPRDANGEPEPESPDTT